MNRAELVAVALWFGALVACRGPVSEGPPQSSTGVPPATGGDAGAELSTRRDKSIYALSMTLTDQRGTKVGLDVFRGTPVYVGMFYGTCPSACPLLVSTIKRVISGLDSRASADIRVLLVSFDPERDTPQALRELATKRGLDARWKLASASDDQVRELAALLGIQYRRLPDGNFSHTSSIVLLDRDGAIDTRLDDMAQSIEPLVSRTEALAAAH